MNIIAILTWINTIIVQNLHRCAAATKHFVYYTLWCDEKYHYLS